VLFVYHELLRERVEDAGKTDRVIIRVNTTVIGIGNSFLVNEDVYSIEE